MINYKFLTKQKQKFQTTVGQSMGGNSITKSTEPIITVKRDRKNPLKHLAATINKDTENDETEFPLPTLPLPADALRFQTRVKQGTIDVW